MGTPDPEYIVNLIRNLVGEERLRAFIPQSAVFVSFTEANQEFGGLLYKKIEPMTANTLAGIIEYSNKDVVVGRPPIIRHESFYSGFDAADTETIGESFSHYDGHQLLAVIAAFTLLIIIADMASQRFHLEEMKRMVEAQRLRDIQDRVANRGKYDIAAQ